MAFDINELASAISQSNGLAYAPHFYVQVTPPKCLQQSSNGQGSIISQIPMFCQATQMPGINYQTFDIATNGFGVFESRPIMALFDNIQLTFYCDAQGKLQQLFQSWVQNIMNFSINQQTNTTVNGAAPGVFNYPDWYEATVQIFQYDPTGQNVINTWTLYNCYPMTLNPEPISWEQENQLLKLNVTLYVKQWATEATTQGNSPGTDSNSYSQTRIDPALSMSISELMTNQDNLQNQLNSNLSPAYSSFTPLTTDTSTSTPQVTDTSSLTVGTTQSSLPSFAQSSSTTYDTGFGSTFVSF